VTLWFLNRDKTPGGSRAWRDRRGELLFIDARSMGHLVNRTHREISDGEIGQVSRTYHAWRGEPGAGEYSDIVGFCKSVDSPEFIGHSHVLTPGRYVGSRRSLEDPDGPVHAAEVVRELLKLLEESDAQQLRVRQALERLDV
jgi:type I restriction enzyme M protein